MKRVKYLLDHKDREFLQKFQINKDVEIKVLKLRANVNSTTGQKSSIIVCPSFDVNTKERGSTDHANCEKSETKRFKCHLCPYSSAIKSYLNRHLWTHLVHKRFKCDKCSFRANTKSHLQYHTIAKHSKNPESKKRNYPCQLCSKSFFRLPALRAHLSVHTKEKPFSCQFCRKEWTRNGDKNYHEIICTLNPMTSDPVWVESQKRFQCKFCSKTFRSKSHLTVHIRSHTQEKPYNKKVQIKLLKLQANVNTKTEQKVPMIFSSSVDVSSKEFGSIDHVDCAKREHKIFKCHVCTYSSTNKNQLKQHSWTHTAYKRFKCDQCSYETNYKRDLKNHDNSKHNKNPESRKRNYGCQLCSKFFFTMTKLRRHLSVHTKEKPFSCQFCSKSFTLNSNKNCHEIICNQNPKTRNPDWVESQKRFQCKLCFKKMLYSAELNVHMRHHTQERPYKCDQCDYAAASASDLKSHGDRRHNPNRIKNFGCELCLKFFFTKTELYQHSQTHTQETSCACGFCKKQFVQVRNRNRHQLFCKSNPKLSNEEWVN